MQSAKDIGQLGRAKDAAQRGAWSEAYEEFRSLDEATLTAEELEAFADSAWWLSRLEESLDVRQKAYAGYLATGATQRAAHVAWFLHYDYLFQGAQSVAAGWLKRAERHLKGEPECVEHGLLALVAADNAHQRGETEPALRLAERAIEIGQRFNDTSLLAMGIQTQGRVLISAGRVTEGSALLDEAMCLLIAGQLTPLFVGWVYCNVLVTCYELGDLRRAAEWTEAAMSWCESLHASPPFQGMCRVHRVELAGLRGHWIEAEVEARRACDELLNFEPHLPVKRFTPRARSAAAWAI